MGRRKCPTPRKQAHDSRGEAEAHLAEVRHHQPREAEGKEAYRCRCGSWHIGDQRGRASFLAHQREQRCPKWETVFGTIKVQDDGCREIRLSGRNHHGAPLTTAVHLPPDATEGEFLFRLRWMVEQLEERGMV